MLRFFKFVFTLGFLLLLVYALVQIGFVFKTRSLIQAPEEVEAQTVAIVLGAKVDENGQPSDILADRLITALKLYQDEKVQKLLLSGDHGQESYDEVKAMRDYLLDYGVPGEDLFLDHAGFDTYDSLYRAKSIFQVDKAIVVTQGFHLPRALVTAQAVGIEVVGVSADRQKYVKALYFVLRETLARVKALKDIVIHAKPTYEGDPISITGDGRATWDDWEGNQPSQ